MRWRKLLGYVSVPALLVGLTVASPEAKTPYKEPLKKAKTVDELIAMYDSSECMSCHADIAEQWSKSLHARSIFGTGRTIATILTTYKVGLKNFPYAGVKDIKDVKVEHLMICAKCHLPQLAEAEDSVAQEIIKLAMDYMEGDEKTSAKAKEKLEKLNINCLICHQRNAIIHKWVEGYPERNVIYGSKDGDHPFEKMPKIKHSSAIKESIFCGQCHGLGPNFEFDEPSQCATLYGYYLWSYVAKGGMKSCQDCHMRESGLGHNIQAYRDKKMQEMAVDFHVNVRPIYWRDGAVIKPLIYAIVEIRNKAGHAIPDG
jgi:nitrate/TMAO reductase-like tetraheme cytochrome c subunit